jgi:hypothetical protein
MPFGIQRVRMAEFSCFTKWAKEGQMEPVRKK